MDSRLRERYLQGAIRRLISGRLSMLASLISKRLTKVLIILLVLAIAYVLSFSSRLDLFDLFRSRDIEKAGDFPADSLPPVTSESAPPRSRGVPVVSTPPMPQVSRTSQPRSEDLLFSAAWFSDKTDHPAGEEDFQHAQQCLRQDEGYLLKFALRDRAFASLQADGRASSYNSFKAAPPGTRLQINYYSQELAPSFGWGEIVVPDPGATSVAAFPVKPALGAAGSGSVYIRLSIGDISFSDFLLHPTILEVDEDCPPSPTLASAVTEGERWNWANILSTCADPQPSLDIVVTPLRGELSFTFPLLLAISSHTIVDGTTGGTLGEINRQLEEMHKALREMAEEDFPSGAIDSQVILPAYRQQILFRLAQEGSILYNLLFPKTINGRENPVRSALESLRDLSLSTEVEDAPRIQRIRIINGAGVQASGRPDRLRVPFGLLYDDPNFSLNSSSPSSVNVHYFWDYRYRVEYEYPRMNCQRPRLCGGRAIRLAAVMDFQNTHGTTWRQQIETQHQLFETLKTRHVLEPEYKSKEGEWRDVLKGIGKFDLIYYYGHTDNGPPPYFDITGQPLDFRQLEEDFEDHPLDFLKGYPVVFLNSCSSGVVSSGGDYNTFLDLLAKRKVSAFIGAEGPMEINYAAEVGKYLMEELVSQSSEKFLGTLFWEMKRETLEQEDGNPLILLYSLIGDPLIRVCAFSEQKEGD